MLIDLIEGDWDAVDGTIVCPPRPLDEPTRQEIATIAAYSRLCKTDKGRQYMLDAAADERRKLNELYAVVLEKLRSRGGVSDEGKHFTWEPCRENEGTDDEVRWQHIRWGPWGIVDTYHFPRIPEVPGSAFTGDVPATHGDRQIADLIVALLNEHPRTVREMQHLRALAADLENQVIALGTKLGERDDVPQN